MIKSIISSALVTMVMMIGLSAPMTSAMSIVECGDSGGAECAAAKENRLSGKSSIVWSIVSTLFLVLGGLAVIFIIIGGIRYAISQGNPGQVKSAKDTILYAVVGLAVALLSYAIVRFVSGFFV
jgi:hypothetical protein